MSNSITMNPGKLARFAQAAYHPDDDGGIHDRRVAEIASETEYAAIHQYDNALIISFRGTDEKPVPWSKDWQRNLDIRFTDSDDNVHALMTFDDHGRVHEGFYNATMDIAVPLLQQVRRRRTHRRYIYIVGHSHGGPMAWITAAILRDAEIITHVVCTYGCPNFCDQTFAANHHHALRYIGFRGINYQAGRWPGWRDPVCHYPRLMRRPGDDVVLPGRFGPLHNHSMDNYVRLLDGRK